MTTFQQFIFVYFVATTALAGFAILWRNWLEDHPRWKEWMRDHLGVVAKALTCGSCFTFWITLFFVIAFNPLGNFFVDFFVFKGMAWPVFYLMQWMSLGWGALFLRFLYVALQEAVGIMVHRFREHNGRE